YFDYINDGFGPVAFEENEFFHALNDILVNDGVVSDLYSKRINNTFKYRDSSNSKRVYNALLEVGQEDRTVDLELLQAFLNQAYEVKNYHLVQERAEKLLLHPKLAESEKQVVYAKLAESY